MHLDDEGELTPTIQQSIKTELEAIAAAEKGDYEKACDLFEISMDLAPKRAAPYNNRAQVYRIQGDNEGMSCVEMKWKKNSSHLHSLRIV